MQRVLRTTALIVLCCAACATGKTFPRDTRLEEAQKAFDEGLSLEDAGQYAAAVPLLDRALALRKTVLGENHPEVAACLNNLAALYMEQGLYAQAEPLCTRALEILEATRGKNHPDVATALNNLANLYAFQGLYERAKPLLLRALEVSEAALGKNHPDVATSLNNLAALYKKQGLYTQAEPLYLHALEIRETALGKSDPDVAVSLNNLALLYVAQGFYARAEPLYLRALEIQEAAHGKTHPDVATSVNNLAALYVAQGLYSRAEPLLARALEIREATLGKNHPDVAVSLNNLAFLYMEQGLYAQAEPLYTRALELHEAALGKNHPDVATSLNNLADLYREQGLYARAEPLYTRALVILATALGENHPSVATALNNLAFLYEAQGLYSRAEPFYARALEILEAALGEHHPAVAASLNNLAFLYKEQGLYSRAEPLYARALQILEAALGENHPEIATALNNLALLRLAQQRLDAALPLFQRSFDSSEKHLRQEVFGLSEQRLASFLQLLRTREMELYALARAHPEDPRVLRLALSAALLRKGRSVKEVATTSQIIYRSLQPADREAFERLRSLRTQLATRSLANDGDLAPSDDPRSLEALAEEGDGLEEDLARRSEPLRRLHLLPSPEQLISQVAAALPRDGALVEFVSYEDRPLVSTPGLAPSQADSHPRYLALLLFPNSDIRAVDLGPAERIDSAARDLHATLQQQSDAYLPAAQGLYALAFRPLVAHLGKAQRLFVTPDGELNLVPFAALHDGRRFLVDTFDISYLTSGKDLLSRSGELPSTGSVVVLAAPDFNAPPASASPVAPPAFSDGAHGCWTPLPGTSREADTIQRLFPQAQVLPGPQATKQALLELSAPSLLHIATHGFFLEGPSPALALGARAVHHAGPPCAELKAGSTDPMLRSGLVLAGANLPAASDSSRSEDSLVTALELAGLNLWGTQLVVLSACDTGRGDVLLGEGVYGLRRALLVAGAETVVTSLWKVSDEATQELMGSYYRHMLAGLGRTSALREAMKELRRKWPHPRFWAAFVALGLDAPLRLPGT